jgi:hypothetical protein
MALAESHVLRLRLNRLLHGVIRRLLLLLLLLQLRRRQPLRPHRKGAGAEAAGEGPLCLLPHSEQLHQVLHADVPLH